MAFLVRLLIAGALMLLAYVAWTVPSPAHQWYDYSCCSDRDCKSVGNTDADWPGVTVTTTPRGYLVHTPTQDELIGFADKRLKPTPPEDVRQTFHVCFSAGRTDSKILCVYAPQGGY